MLLASLDRGDIGRQILAALMVVALLLAPFHAHEFVTSGGSLVAVAVADGDGDSNEDPAPSKAESGCALCWLGKKLQLPLKDMASTVLLLTASILYPPREGDMAPRSAIFGVFRPPSTPML